MLAVGAALWNGLGDQDTAEVMDAIAADDIRHVAFGNEWLDRIKRENPAELLKAISAISQVRQLAVQLSPEIGKELPHDIPINNEDRARAGFAS